MSGLCQALSHIRRVTQVIWETKDNINLAVAGMVDVPKIASGELLLFSSPEAEDWSQDGILSLCFEVITSKLLEIIGNIF